MPRAHIVNACQVVRTPRVQQLEGLFDVAPSKRSELTWDVELPIDDAPWNIGLIVGPSGCGKTSIARQLFGDAMIERFEWSPKKSIVDDFPTNLGIKEITGLLSSVGFSSPPSWIRPFGALSNGEQFRVTMARALAEARGLVVMDEFTSVVDRTVAQIGSAAIAKTIRTRNQRFIAVACHSDIIEWLQPDWTYEPAGNYFQWRYLRRRPELQLKVVRVDRSAWTLFKHHHYLDTDIHRGSKCFLGTIAGRPAVFTAVMRFPHPTHPSWREHRTVCLPDFQGVGVGNAMSEFVASLFTGHGERYTSTTSHPAMIRHRHRSPLWRMIRAPSFASVPRNAFALRNHSSFLRATAGFEYTGPPRIPEASAFGIC